MNTQIQWTLEMSVHDGQADGVQALVDELVAATQANEPGALLYEYYLSEEKDRCTVLERYADSAAVMTHLQNFQQHFAERFFAAFEPRSFRVFGPASDEVRSALTPLGATFDAQISGFCR